MIKRFRVVHAFASLSFAVLIFQIFPACTTSRFGPNPVAIDEADSTSGIAVFSVSVKKADVNTHSIKIVHDEYEMKGAMEVLVRRPDKRNDSISTFYQAMVLPAGDYRIYGWTMTAGHGRGEFKFISKGNFSIPFTVRAGHVSYLGDYLGIAKYGYKLMFSRQSYNAYYIVSNQFQEDLQAMKTKFPKLEMEKAIIEIPDFATSNNEYSGMYLKGVQLPNN